MEHCEDATLNLTKLAEAHGVGKRWGEKYTTNKVMGKLWWMARPFSSSGITCLVVCTPTYLYSRSKNDAITCTSHARTLMSVTHQFKTLFTFALQYDAYESAEKSVGIWCWKHFKRHHHHQPKCSFRDSKLCLVCLSMIYTAKFQDI